jgi:hypothetical protein
VSEGGALDPHQGVDRDKFSIRQAPWLVDFQGELFRHADLANVWITLHPGQDPTPSSTTRVRSRPRPATTGRPISCIAPSEGRTPESPFRYGAEATCSPTGVQVSLPGLAAAGLTVEPAP